MFHFQIKLLRMIYVFTTAQNEQNKEEMEVRESEWERRNCERIKHCELNWALEFELRILLLMKIEKIKK